MSNSIGINNFETTTWGEGVKKLLVVCGYFFP